MCLKCHHHKNGAHHITITRNNQWQWGLLCVDFWSGCQMCRKMWGGFESRLWKSYSVFYAKLPRVFLNVYLPGNQPQKYTSIKIFFQLIIKHCSSDDTSVHPLMVLAAYHYHVDLQQLIFLASWWQQKHILADISACLKLMKCTGWKDVKLSAHPDLCSNIIILQRLTDSWWKYFATLCYQVDY